MKNLEFLTKPIDSLNMEPFSSFFNRDEGRLSLNGEWKFIYLKEMDDKYLDPSFDIECLDNIKVPSHIEFNNYDITQYVNMMYPWEGKEDLAIGDIPKVNPVGIYFKDVEIKDLEKEHYLEFEGFESALYLYINGKFVGYTTHNFVTSTFKINDYMINEPNYYGEMALNVAVTAGKIDSMAFEKSFGRGKDIDPVEVPIANNKAIRIEGKIDRIDYLEGNTVKVIDYKSGTESIKPQDAEYGWRLQLMLYLKAATEGVCKEERKFLPAGVFYFMIKDKEITGDGIDKDKLTVKINEALSDYKMQGIIVDNPDVIKNTAGSFEGWSDIVTGLRSVKGEGSGFKFQSSNLMSSEEFEEFEGRFDKMLEGLCNDLTEGMIEARPKKTKNMSACTYCPYHSICKFEQIFAGCSYERIPC